MLRLVPLAVAVALLALAGPASAKRVVAAKVCGASECREVEDRDLLAPLHESDDVTRGPPKVMSGWYRATLFIQAGDHREPFKLDVFPTDGYVRAYDGILDVHTWTSLTSNAKDAYRQIVRGLDPLPLSSLPGGFAEPPPEPAGFPWGWIAGGMLVVTLAGAALLGLLRRRGAALRSSDAQAAG